MAPTPVSRFRNATAKTWGNKSSPTITPNRLFVGIAHCTVNDDSTGEDNEQMVGEPEHFETFIAASIQR